MKAMLALLLASTAVVLAQPKPEPTPPPVVPPVEAKPWYTRFSVAPFGTVNHPDLSKPVWGAGLDIGINLNEYVSLHVANLAYDMPKTTKTHGETGHQTSSQGFDSGMGIDETSVLGRADVWNYKSTLNLFLLASGDREWNEEIWGIGAGGGIGFNLHKNISLEGDVRIRAWFKHRPKDLPIRFLVNIKF